MTPDRINKEGRFDSFDNGEILLNKKKNHLPPMGWNSWNAFGSNNTEALTRAMVDKIKELELDKLGYKFIVLDDGCYKPERVNGRLVSDEVKFASGFNAMSDYVHSHGLKFGMYNDIGDRLCSGAQVGTCGYEDVDAQSYVDWKVDFMKVDNCYYLWDNATFSNPENARYTFAPNIKAVKIDGKEYSAVKDGKVTGFIGKVEKDYVTFLGTFDGTGPDASPLEVRSSELVFEVEAEEDKTVSLAVEYATGKKEGVGEWLELAVGEDIFFDDFVEPTESEETFVWSRDFEVSLKKGINVIRVMNHRRQENTLNSYSRFLRELNKLKPDHDIIYSACEWGKTHPQNWAYKVCDSWRILNDITFRVGNDGDPGVGNWKDDYTPSVTSQYNKAVIMDEFAGLDKGWNDPDMLMIGMNGLNDTQYRTHMATWCMMNSPLFLGLDLRRVKKGDALYQIIANKDLIDLNQDALGVQAKRVFSSLAVEKPDKEYIRDINRVDILCKPLSGGDFALCFVNVSEEDKKGEFSADVKELSKIFAGIKSAGSYEVKDLWTKEVTENTTGVFTVKELPACASVTLRITPKN